MEAPRGLEELFRVRPPARCRIDYAVQRDDGKHYCRKCGRQVVGNTRTRSGWQHKRGS